jgi:hypothetical protein
MYKYRLWLSLVQNTLKFNTHLPLGHGFCTCHEAGPRLTWYSTQHKLKYIYFAVNKCKTMRNLTYADSNQSINRQTINPVPCTHSPSSAVRKKNDNSNVTLPWSLFLLYCILSEKSHSSIRIWRNGYLLPRQFSLRQNDDRSVCSISTFAMIYQITITYT